MSHHAAIYVTLGLPRMKKFRHYF